MRQSGKPPAPARAGRLLLLVFLGGLVAVSTSVFLVYAFSSRVVSLAVEHDEAGARPPSTPASGDAKPARVDDGFTLHPEDHVYREAKTIYLDWNITQGLRAPDGVVKTVYLINGQFPGPLVEARSGDELVVNVHNHVDRASAEEGVAVHWHGLTMKGANDMDGVVALTQCAIPASANLTYRFHIDDSQSGTYWYHAHSGVQRADGLFGGLVVHKPANTKDARNELATHSYDAEQLLLVGDWYHRSAVDVLEWFEDPNHYMYEPAPDSMLINGRGSYNCSMAVKAWPVNCSSVAMPETVLRDRRVRLRVVNTGVSAGITLSLSEGSMQVITVDGGHAVANDTHAARSIGVLYPGERMDVIVQQASGTTARARSEQGAKLIVTLDKENMNLHNFALTPEQEFPLSWTSPSVPERRHEEGVAASELNLNDLRGAPLGSSPTGLAEPAETAVLYSAMTIRGANHNRPVATVNHTSWVVSEPHKPPLLALDRAQWVDAIKQPTSAQKLKVPWIKETGEERWMELVLNNYDDKGHPFHLVSFPAPAPPFGPRLIISQHGYSFYVVRSQTATMGLNRGYNPFDKQQAEAVAAEVDTKTPLRKDTVYVPSMGYVVLRFALDNNGLWLLHCHVLWHQAVGMGIVLQVGDIDAGAKQRAGQRCLA
ncbi:hypothetical protein JDV02_001970 [Purpureocillium takamizusanense]|uniref:Uncharacterized protein n=1 Tax=Purpureocillium takamizusanense TaxID=2060973 RepID=A0A9Q8QAM3_9HYPO|nr:uncharacterized protein JDV02_001970 [Purpureocillium takamizusanense]UNI15436.1 hypothetical protein JDV02_001970 [Purpureocillium takamizusanense]